MNSNPTLPISDFQSLISRVMSEGRPAQKQLADSDGHQYKLRITPYRSNEGLTNGCVITVVDISLPAVNNLLTLRGNGEGRVCAVVSERSDPPQGRLSFCLGRDNAGTPCPGQSLRVGTSSFTGAPTFELILTSCASLTGR